MKAHFVEVCVKQIPVFTTGFYTTPKPAVDEARYNRDEIQKHILGALVPVSAPIGEWFDGWFDNAVAEFEANDYKPDVHEADGEDVYIGLFGEDVHQDFVPPK